LVAAAEDVLALGVRKQVVAHCLEGAVLIRKGGARASHGSVRVPPKSVIGTAGAGDAFAAGVILGLHGGEEPRECLRWGVCGAALCLSDPTTSGGLDDLEKALKNGEAHGFRAPSLLA
jgi:sugar/nucleoside kinase (ribokinase family)